MIYGIGVDMASSERVQRACQKKGFEARFFSDAEQQMFAEHILCNAKRGLLSLKRPGDMQARSRCIQRRLVVVHQPAVN
ncbi:MAG: hypothetical protein IJC61_00045, partial [Oscillospiraceae bacterium]|nr:hypothetical protein [Oscillospiraceae bacterium]